MNNSVQSTSVVGKKKKKDALDSILNTLEEGKKVSTLEKSSYDWDSFRKKSEHADEMEKFKKDGYIMRSYSWQLHCYVFLFASIFVMALETVYLTISHLISSRLISYHLLSSPLISPHLLSSNLLSSHRILSLPRDIFWREESFQIPVWCSYVFPVLFCVQLCCKAAVSATCGSA